MPRKMLQFVTLGQQMPDKRPAAARRADFHEIHEPLTQARAGDQSSRCEQCGIPFCQIHCPVQNNIPDWLMLTAAGRMEEAYAVSSATNTFPEICGRICPQDRLCEGNCVLERSRHGAITIGAVEKHITETAWDNGWVRPPSPKVERPHNVGVIGGGPAGLAAADSLRRRGYGVRVYDRHDRMGGLMTYGIPSFKLEKSVVARRIDLLERGGVQFEANFEVGRDATLAELRQRHDALLIATGVYAPRVLTVPGAGLAGAHRALDYLIASNRKGLGDPVPAFDDGTLNARGRDVVVIGGGDTAMDCVRTAVRQGARSVKCLYRRDRANMPGSRREVAHAEEEGIEFVWLAQPVALLGDGAVRAVRVRRMHLGVADSSGRQTPTPIEGSDFDVPADMVIEALGFDPEDVPTLFGAPELAVSRWGTLEIDLGSKMTSIPGVFAAGDIVRGASLVVWAIRDGQDAASAIHDWIQAGEKTNAAE
ncbi:MAG: NAD(P)-dependent oxidoreductase [Alphaproteobacteria bacterium]|nr:NAD(P)-dependent oxidoreductase [Alphaproteobacteria bacterium]